MSASGLRFVRLSDVKDQIQNRTNRRVRAADAELHDDGDLRIVCGCCNVDILVVEKR